MCNVVSLMPSLATAGHCNVYSKTEPLQILYWVCVCVRASMHATRWLVPAISVERKYILVYHFLVHFRSPFSFQFPCLSYISLSSSLLFIPCFSFSVPYTYSFSLSLSLILFSYFSSPPLSVFLHSFLFAALHAPLSCVLPSSLSLFYSLSLLPPCFLIFNKAGSLPWKSQTNFQSVTVVCWHPEH